MRVLVAVDQSEASLACIKCVIHHTWPSGTEFGLISAVRHNPLDLQGNLYLLAQENLIALGQQVHKHASGPLVGADCVEGNPSELVLGMAARWPAELIVVGSDNKTGLAKLLLGSVSQAVLKHSNCSVLVVRDVRPSEDFSFTRVVVAIDGSLTSELAVTWLGEHPWPQGVEFRFVCVMAPSVKLLSPEPGAPGIEDPSQRSAQEQQVVAQIYDVISRFAPSLLSHAISTDLEQGDPETEILELAKKWSADLIVVGTHNRYWLERIWEGSVSIAVASHAPCSVLVVKAGFEEVMSEAPASAEVGAVPHTVPYFR